MREPAWVYTEDDGVDPLRKRRKRNKVLSHTVTQHMLVVMFAVASRVRCEFTVDSLITIDDAVTAGFMRWDSNSAYTIHYASERHGIGLTDKGKTLVEEVFEKILKTHRSK